ncbi:hypothetical protein V1281_006730 [Nitrobacteraceae bacterium AZCC 2161]
MLSPRLYTETWDIDVRLQPFGVSRAELIEVVRGVVAARADAVTDDPVTAEGLFAYIYGTRFLRGLFRPKGWLRIREDGIEAVRHPQRNLKVVYQSVDLAASSQHPRAVSGKGAGADRLIDLGQGSLFSDEEIAAANPVKVGEIDTGVWFFCVSVIGDDVRAELSLPSGVKNGNFDGFLERIFIVRPGEWAELAFQPDVGDDAVEFEPIVTRK